MIYPKTNQILTRRVIWQTAVLLLLTIALILSISLFYEGIQQPQSVSSTQFQQVLSGELPTGLTAHEWNHLQHLMSNADYHIAEHTPTSDYPAGFYWAPNQAQNWHTSFSPQGVEITPKNGATWSWGLTLTGYGYGSDAWQNVASNTPTLQSDKNQLFYLWNDNLSEWWINSQSGLEQGFTLQQRPAGQTAGTPLTLDMAVTGNLTPVLYGDTIFFQNGSGATVLTYDKLYVFDAHGRTIPARFALPSPDTVQIQVDDHTAVYPLTIDPWVEMARLTSSDHEAGDTFGRAVAINGDTIVVGASQEDDGGISAGAAYVFVRPNNGWANATETAKLTASDATAGDFFGYSVAISDDTIVVGSYGDDIVNFSSGSAYVFEEPVGGWVNSTETAKLTPSDPGQSDFFGWAVAIDDDTIVVGARFDDDGATNTGSVYVFVEPGGGWVNTTETAKLIASDGSTADELGYSVGVSGDTVVGGAHQDDIGGSNSGSLYIFVEPGGGWVNATETAKLTASDGATNDALGFSVAISGDTVVGGAYGDDDVSTGSGSVYIFIEPGGGWTNSTETAKLTASDPGEIDNFGYSVAISGDAIIAGAYNDDDVGNNAGAAYLFVKPTTGWITATETLKLTSVGVVDSERFGFSVSIHGSTAVVGTFPTNSASETAYVFGVPAIMGDVEGGLGPGGVGRTDGSTALVGWWRADAGITESSGSITGWADHSGNGNNADGTGHEPAFVATDANFNNQPTIDFDGSDDYFGFIGLTSVFSASTWYAAFEADVIPAGCCASLLSADGDPTGAVQMQLNANDFQFNVDGRSPAAAASSTAWSANTPYFLGTIDHRNSTTIWQNGSHTATTPITIPEDQQYGPGRIGDWDSGTRNFDGRIPEIILFSTPLQEVERILVENYLSSKYAIPLAANDVYDGDTTPNGDFDLDVAGIGQFDGNQHALAHAAGMIVVNNSFLNDDGDWLLFGHNNVTNASSGADLPTTGDWGAAPDPRRWARHFYIDVTDNTAGTDCSAAGTCFVDIIFDYSEGGMDNPAFLPAGDANNYRLLRRVAATGQFEDIATATAIVGDQVQFIGIDVADLGSNFTLGTLDAGSSPTAVSLSSLQTSVPNQNLLLILGFILLTVLTLVFIRQQPNTATKKN